jgi:hypothetical protein
VKVQRPTGSRMIPVVISGYREPVVRLVPRPDASAKARRLLAAWEGAKE